MAWQINFNSLARKQFLKLDFHSQKMIINYFTENVLSSPHPKAFGKPLVGNLRKFWRYRVGKFRIICSIDDLELIILVVGVAHRADVYQ